MNNIKAAGVIFIILCVVVIYASLSTNSMVSDQISSTNNDILSRAPKAEKVKEKMEPVAKDRRRIQPEDPAKYGMIVMPDSKAPRTESDWEAHLSSVIDKKAIFESKEGQEMLSQIQEDEAAFQKNMSDLNKKIDAFKKELAEDPLNEKREEQLQNLYKLRAIGNIVNNKINESTLERMPMNVGPANTEVPNEATNKGH